jgi:hypothetical protein
MSALASLPTTRPRGRSHRPAGDALTVKRVFGEPYERDGVTVIAALRAQAAPEVEASGVTMQIRATSGPPGPPDMGDLAHDGSTGPSHGQQEAVAQGTGAYRAAALRLDGWAGGDRCPQGAHGGRRRHRPARWFGLTQSPRSAPLYLAARSSQHGSP